MKSTVKKVYRLELSQETAECLLALIYCNLCSLHVSPLDSLFCGLKVALGVGEDDYKMSVLADKYEKFV